MEIPKPEGAKPKVAILSRTFSKGAGGAESYAVNLAEQLADDFEFHVLIFIRCGLYHQPIFDRLSGTLACY